MSSNETADIRRAFERLQIALEALGERYRDLRRERRQLRDRIDELVREREATTVATAAELDAAQIERRRAAELEERATLAEKRHQELYHRIGELEDRVAEREAIVADQEDLLQRLRSDILILGRERDDAQEQGALLRSENQRLQRDLGSLETRYRELEGSHQLLASEHEGAAGEEIDRLQTEIERLQEKLEGTRAERAELEERHRVALQGLERELSTVRHESEAAGATIEKLTFQLKSIESSDDERLKAQRLRIEELSRDLSEALDMAGRYETELSTVKEQSEELDRHASALEQEIERLRQSAGQLNGAGGYDEEEKAALAERIDSAIALIDRHLQASAS